MIDLNSAKSGEKFITRSGEVVTFVEHYHINHHKVLQNQKGEEYLVTQYGHALNLKNDVIKKVTKDGDEECNNAICNCYDVNTVDSDDFDDCEETTTEVNHYTSEQMEN